MFDFKKRAVVMGGGNGSAITIQALKNNLDYFDIRAVVSMSDSGGSSGRLREEFSTLPPGDIMRAVLAMSVYDYKTLKVIFHRIRFDNAGKLSGHNLGNLFLVLAQRYGENYMDAIRSLEQAVQARGKVYPATMDDTQLEVELSDGSKVVGEGRIDRPFYDKSLNINKAYLDPSGTVYKGARQAIEKADYIFLGPGSLYCSIISSLLPNGVKDAIAASSAKIIYIAGNAREIEGETGPEVLSGFVRILEEYLPRKIDSIIYNYSILDIIQQKKYEQKKWGLVPNDMKDNRVISQNYERESGGLCKDKLGRIIMNNIDKF